MCKNPMWRVPVPEDVAAAVFMPGYKNGAFVIPQSQESRFAKLLKKLEARLDSELKLNMIYSSISVIGCGKCVECKIKTSKEWAQRSVCEASMHVDNWFVTLTYDDEHLPLPIPTYSRHSYDYGLWSPLLYEDFEKFKKRLLEYIRYHYNVDGIRFLMCGEYGPKNGRPHFHVIFYGLPLPDVVKHNDLTVKGRPYVYLSSEIIDNCWGKGFTTLGEVNWETSAYVGRYVMKKFSNLEEFDYCKLCYDNGWEPLPPEMRQASRNPGLARPFYDVNKDEIYNIDKVVLPNGRTPQPCQYFDRLFDLEDPELLSQIRENRKEKAFISQINERSKFKNDNEYKNYLKNKSAQFERKIKKLERPL